MELEEASYRAQLGGLDQLAVGDLDRMERPFKFFLPKIEEFDELRKIRKKIIGLPYIALQQPMMIGTPIQNVGGCQPITFDLLMKIRRNHHVLLGIGH
jgi:hypothetical protein